MTPVDVFIGIFESIYLVGNSFKPRCFWWFCWCCCCMACVYCCCDLLLLFPTDGCNPYACICCDEGAGGNTAPAVTDTRCGAVNCGSAWFDDGVGRWWSVRCWCGCRNDEADVDRSPVACDGWPLTANCPCMGGGTLLALWWTVDRWLWLDDEDELCCCCSNWWCGCRGIWEVPGSDWGGCGLDAELDGCAG